MDKYDNNRADAEFAAGAREDIPALIAEVKRLRAGAAPIYQETQASVMCSLCRKRPKIEGRRTDGRAYQVCEVCYDRYKRARR